MEEKSLTSPFSARRLVIKFLLTLPLAIPIMAIMYYDDRILAEIVDIGDPVPVNLTTDVPIAMSMVSWALLAALITAFTPFKRLSAMAVGLSIGGISFYALDQYEQLKDMEEMGLSSKPLMDIVQLTSDGKCLIAWIVICLITQAAYGLVTPILHKYKK